MYNLKTYNLAKEILVVSVPEGASVWINQSITNFLHIGNLHGDAFSKEIPDGYSILSTAKEMTEDKAKTLIEFYGINRVGYSGFKDYIKSTENKQYYTFKTALESFHSFMKANNIDYNSVILYKDK